jgi:hypothetical protein
MQGTNALLERSIAVSRRAGRRRGSRAAVVSPAGRRLNGREPRLPARARRPQPVA